MAIFNPVKPFPWKAGPLSGVTPFTYRDGMTYAVMLEQVRNFVEALPDDLNKNLTELVAEFETGINGIENRVTESEGRYQAWIADFLEDATSKLEPLNDAAASRLILSAGSAVRKALDLEYVKANELVVDVVSFGAVGDGRTDNTQAVQAAIDFIAARGGGSTLFFPPGEYVMDNAAYLTGNMNIVGAKATLVKRYESKHYAFFIGSSGTQKGYGAGPSNIVVDGLNFRGSFESGKRRIACAFSLHHSENITVRNCTFSEMSGGGHRFDLAGCRNIKIQECVFEGFDTSYGSGFYNEDIQLDFSINGSPSHTEESNLCFDGLPTRNVRVTGCEWRPLKKYGTTFPAANPMGSHSANEGNFIRDIFFENNIIGGPGGIVQDTGSGVTGVLHFMCPKNLHIIGNTIHNDGKANYAIHVAAAVGGIPWNEVGNADAVWTQFANGPQVAEDVFIQRNTITGFTHTRTDRDLIVVTGHATGPTYAKNINISDNILGGNNAPSGGNIGPNMVYITYAVNVTVHNNTTDKARRLCFITNSRQVFVTYNTATRTNQYAIHVDLSESVHVDGNILEGSIAGWDIYLTTCVSGSVNGNIIKTGKGASAFPAMRFTYTRKMAVTSNDITAPADVVAGAKGIETINGSKDNIISSNIIQGFESAIVHANGSSSTDGVNIITPVTA